MEQNLFLIVTLTVIAFSVLFWMIYNSSKNIKDGEVGLVLKRGKTTEKVLSPGKYFLRPFVESVVKYPGRELTYMVVESDLIESVQAKYKDLWTGHPLDITTADNATASILYTIRFRLIKESVPLIHDRFGKDAIRGIIRDESRHIIRMILNEKNYTTSDLLGPSRAKVEYDISERLQKKLIDVGIEMTHLGLREPDLGELGKKLKEQMNARQEFKLQQELSKVEDENNLRAEKKAESESRINFARVKSEAEASAMANKIQTEVEAESEQIKHLKTVEAKLEAAKLIAQKEIAEAEAQVKIEKLKAEMEAYSIIKKAEATAAANKFLTDSINDELMKWSQSEILAKAANRWDGKLPLFSGEKPFSFMNLSPLLETLTNSVDAKNKMGDEVDKNPE